MQKNWKIKEKGNLKTIGHLMQVLNVSEPVATILTQRNINSYAEAKEFFRPSLKNLHDPFLMKNMGIAVSRILQSIYDKEKIMIYGDYDVDGTSAVALVYDFLSQHTTEIDFYIPDRHTEGYGVSYQGIDFAVENNYKLIITLDCGIKAVKEIKYGKEKGIDFIICDHHQPDNILPPAVAILNPKQKYCNYPYKELSGCGIGFKLIQAIAKTKRISSGELEKYLDLTTLSIASDIVPITGENRILAYHGLNIINNNPCSGIEAILKTANIKRRPDSLIQVNYNFTKYLTISDLVFSVGPRVNASGRVDNAKNSVQLLISKSFKEADKIAEKINIFNSERRSLDKQAFEEALQMINSSKELQNKKTTVLFSPNWHKGIIGIVASRLIEYHYKPTVIFTQSDGILTASARSIKDFDLYSAIEECSDLLLHFGGHKYAAGFSLLPEKLKDFEEKFEKIASQTLTDAILTPKIEIDYEIDFKQITQSFIKVLKQFAPYGPDNMSPVFLTKNVYDTGFSRTVGENHLKLNITQPEFRGAGFDAVAFGFGHLFDKIHSQNRPFSICYTIEENEWNNKITTQLNIKDIRIED